MKKVLIITHYFPPRPGIGSVRLGGLAKYLPEFGWHPIVLTPVLPDKKSGNIRIIEVPHDRNRFLDYLSTIGSNRLDKPKARNKIFNYLNRKPPKFIFNFIELLRVAHTYRDSARKGFGTTYRYATDLIKKESIDVILSSSSPVTTHLIAKNIKTKNNVHWLADLRDLWTQNHYYPYGIIRKYAEKLLELHTLKIADALVTVSEPLSEKLGELHKHKRIFTITNGFDPGDHVSMPLTTDFTITYTGKLYGEKRDPRLFLTVIRDLIKSELIDNDRVQIRFFGPKEKWLEAFVIDNGLESIVFFDHVDRNTSLIKQSESQLLLLLNWNDPRETGVYTGKLFEYLGANRPIMSIGGGYGVVHNLLQQTKAGIHLSDVDDIKACLLEYYRSYVVHGSVEYSGLKENIEKYTHLEMARNFANAFEQVLQDK